MELQSQVDELREKGLGLAVISYDADEAITAFAEQYGITYTMLSDQGSRTIREFGILNPVPEWAFGPDSDNPAVQADVELYVSVFGPREMMIGMAFPGTFMLDTDGRVTSRFFEDFYIERNTVSNIMVRVGDGLAPVAATKITTPQLDLTTYLSDSELAIGRRFSVMLDVEPHEDMHVYAPGASSYRVISLSVDAQQHVELVPIEYPDSQTYYFEPFDEYVPVYTEPFVLAQQMIVDGSREAQAALRDQEELTVTGTLEYQACSSTICYPPQAIPLSWTMPLRPLILQRPLQQ